MSAQPMVFSIRPQYVERIEDRAKKWEFRRRRPRLRRGEQILIYETARGRGAIVATAKIGDIIEGHPDQIWRKTDPDGCVSIAEYAKYFEDRDRAVAIQLLEVESLDEPRKLPPGMSAPQAWARYKGQW